MSTSTIDTMNLPGKAFGLGSPIAEFRISPKQPWILTGLVALVGLVAFAGPGLLDLLSGYSSGWVLVRTILGLIMLAVAAQQFYVIIHNRDLRVIALDKGFVRVGGGKSDVVRWDEITGVYQAVVDHYHRTAYVFTTHTGTTHTYTIWTEDSTRIVLTDMLINVETLGAMIQKRATESLLPGYMDDYEGGEDISFNGLSLSKAGINSGTRTLPWDQVEGVGLNRGHVIVRQRGAQANWGVQTVAMTPNLFVFLAMVDQIVGLNQKKK